MNAVLKYWVERGQINDKMEFIETIRQGLSPSQPMEKEIMTIAECFRLEGLNEGRQEGHQEGRQEGQEIVALKLLKRGDSLQDVAEVTGLEDKRLATLWAEANNN